MPDFLLLDMRLNIAALRMRHPLQLFKWVCLIGQLYAA